MVVHQVVAHGAVHMDEAMEAAGVGGCRQAVQAEVDMEEVVAVDGDSSRGALGVVGMD